jgi:hypothetical protein
MIHIRKKEEKKQLLTLLQTTAKDLFRDLFDEDSNQRSLQKINRRIIEIHVIFLYYDF